MKNEGLNGVMDNTYLEWKTKMNTKLDELVVA